MNMGQIYYPDLRTIVFPILENITEKLLYIILLKVENYLYIIFRYQFIMFRYFNYLFYFIR